MSDLKRDDARMSGLLKVALLMIVLLVWPAHISAVQVPETTVPIEAENEVETPAEEKLPTLEEFVDGVVEAVLDEYSGLPGVTISVVKDGEVLLAKGYGYANIEKNIAVDPATSMFRIGSISKTFTGLAVMQLVEQGKLDLDADVNTYLEAFKIPDTFDKPITLRALISHRGGFEDAGYGHIFWQDPKDVMSMEEYLAKYMPKRVREPGVTTTYSNYGIALAGYLVEVASGQDFASYVEDQIFKPLGMNHSTARDPLGPDYPNGISLELTRYLAEGYAKGPGGKPVRKPPDLISHIGPAGSIYSTALDMAHYMMARLDHDRYPGGELVARATSDRMRSRLYDDRPLMMDMAHTMVDGTQNGYKIIWHNGGTTTFAAEMVLYPEINFGVFVALNSSDGGPHASYAIPRLIFERYFPPRPELETPKPPADFVERGEKYVGDYMSTRRSYTKAEKLLSLTGVSHVSLDDDGYLILSGGGNHAKLVEIEPGVFQTINGDDLDRGRTHHVYFFEDENGNPVRMARVANDLERISFWQTPKFLFVALGAAVFFSLTTLLGAWRRAGRPVPRVEKNIFINRITDWLPILAAVATLAATAGLVMTGMTAASNFAVLLFHWPTAPLMVALWMTLAIVVFVVGMTALTGVVWTSPQWKIGRRIHYTLFTLSLAALVAAFYQWNLVGFNFY